MEKLPLFLTGMVLEYLSTNSDRKNCRLVCHNWCYLIDTYLGLGLKLTKRNKDRALDSDLLRSCTSLKIYESAGLLHWYVCPVSRKNLKSVEIRGNILSDNWKLLLLSCESLEFLTITVHELRKGNVKPFDFSDHNYTLNHSNLRRITFREINPNILTVISSIANMINTIGEAPRLRQIVMNYMYNPIEMEDQEELQNYSYLKTALVSLMGRIPSNIISFALIHQMSCFSDPNIWDEFLRQGKSFIIIQIGGIYYLDWQEIFDRVINETLDTVYYGVYDHIYYNELSATLIGNFRIQSLNLRKLYITLCCPRHFNCRILQDLHNLSHLALYNFKTAFQNAPRPTVTNIFALAENNSKLETFYISILISKNNVHDIFKLPQLKELHFKKQKGLVLKRQHFENAVNHPSLKLIFWDKQLHKKWDQFRRKSKVGHNIEVWKSMMGKAKEPPKSAIMHLANWKALYVLTKDEGYVRAKKWSKYAACNSFVVFNRERLDESDLERLRTDFNP